MITDDLTVEKPLAPLSPHAPGSVRELLGIALPMMASTACDTVMTFTSRMFLSKLGAAEMNGALAGGIMSFLMMTFFVGLIGYSTALIGHYYGSGRKESCSVVVVQAGIIALVAYPIILLLAPLVRSAFAHSGVSPEQLGPQTIYFNVLVCGAIFGLMRNVFSSFFSGIGRTRTVMAASAITMLVNVAASYALILGRFGAPALGIRGAGYAVITGSAVGMAILAAAYFLGKRSKEYAVSRSFRFDWEIMRKLLRFGYPAGLEFVLSFGAYGALVSLFQAQGQTSATAATITFNWDMVAYVPLVGIEIAVTSLMGRYKGAQRPDVANRSTVSGIRVGMLYSAIMLVLFAAFPSQLIGAFRPQSNDAVYYSSFPLTLFMVRLMAFYVLFESMIVSYCGALRGAGDTFWAMIINVGLHWLQVAVLYVLFTVVHVSPKTAWCIMILWVLMLSFAFHLRYRTGHWRSIRVIGDLEPAA